MVCIKKSLLYILFVFAIVFSLSCSAFAARAANQIEVYKIGDTSLTFKWTPYTPTSGTVQRYVVNYKVSGNTTYSAINVDGTTSSPDYNPTNNEFSKKITGLNIGTIYDVQIDTYLLGNPTPIVFYNSIKVMTKIAINRDITLISNPYGNDNVGHIDFTYNAPIEMVGGALSSVDKSNITGYSLVVSLSQGQIYSSGQPYKVIYDGIGNYNAYKVSTIDVPLTYDPGSGAVQFSFTPQSIDGKDALGFALYKANQPSTDNFNMATIYYVFVQPIFKTGSGYENVIIDATARYETVDNIATLLPLSVSQVANDLVELKFSSVGTGSMSYDVYRGRLPNALTRIHTEYDDGTRNVIQYFNKIDNPQDDDVYYFKVAVSGQTYGVSSKVMPIAISLTPNIAPAMKNVKIERVIGDSVLKSSDVIISWDKPDNEDINKANLVYRVYINTDQESQVNTNDVVHDGSGNIVKDSNGYVVLNTTKDINGNDILLNGLPVVYERIAEVLPTTFSGIGFEYTGNDPVGNYLSTGNNYYKIIRDGEEVIRTIYRIRGTNFLTNADAPFIDGGNHTIYLSNFDEEIATDYKTKMELNTNYFLKMDSYNDSIGQKSDFSVPVGFTTPTDVVSSIPTPENFEVELIDTNKIGLLWEPLNNAKYDSAKVTYEVFVSTNGSYDDAAFNQIKTLSYILKNDGKQHILIDSSYSLIDALGNDLPNMPASVNPNTVYLFRIRASWNTIDGAGNNVVVYSGLSPIIPVTTKRLTISDPDMTAPPAPVDFAASSVSSKTATLTWSKVDDFSTYRIIRTTNLIDQFAPVPAPPNDGVTTGFALTGNVYSYSDGNLVSNTLYYFSIRSENVVNGNTLYSPWITVPVTTILVEAPTGLIVTSRSKDGHSVTISWNGRGNLDYQAAKKDDSMINYQIAEGISGNSGTPDIKSFQLTLNNLSSNTSYLIKVRSKDAATGIFSKYSEPIQVRTGFNQIDYDASIKDNEKKLLIDEITAQWIKEPISKIGYETGKLELLVKSQASSNAKNSSSPAFTVNITDEQSQNKNVYIPSDLVDTLNSVKKNLEIRTEEGSIFFRPGIITTDKMPEIFSLLSVASKVLKVQVNELSSTDTLALVPKGDFAASKALDVSVRAIGYNKTTANLNAAIIDKINTIATQEKALVGSRTEEQVKTLIDLKIRTEVKALLLSSLVFETTYDMGSGKARMNFSYNIDESGKSSGYVVYLKNDSTSGEIQGQINDEGKIDFEAPIPTKLVILGKSGPSDVGSSTISGDIKTLISKYDFSNEIVNGKFRPDDAAKVEEVISFIIDVLNPNGASFEGLTTTEKAEKLGLLENFPVWKMKNAISKEELAYLLSKVYQLKTGIDPNDVVSSKPITIQDGYSINQAYRNSVIEIIDNGIMSTNSGYFYPSRQVTRADAASAILKLMRLFE